MNLINVQVYEMNYTYFQESGGEAPAKVESKKTKKEDFSSDAKTSDGQKWNMKIVSWNVDGLRAWLKVT